VVIRKFEIIGEKKYSTGIKKEIPKYIIENNGRF
jgi:hypothetical protein